MDSGLFSGSIGTGLHDGIAHVGLSSKRPLPRFQDGRSRRLPPLSSVPTETEHRHSRTLTRIQNLARPGAGSPASAAATDDAMDSRTANNTDGMQLDASSGRRRTLPPYSAVHKLDLDGLPSSSPKRRHTTHDELNLEVPLSPSAGREQQTEVLQRSPKARPVLWFAWSRTESLHPLGNARCIYKLICVNISCIPYVRRM